MVHVGVAVPPRWRRSCRARRAAGPRGAGGAPRAGAGPLGDPGQDRRPDRAPRPLIGVPAGRGGGTTSLVRRDPAPDRALAWTGRWGGVTGASHGATGAK